jgi:DNA phosphorothioation-dependent restriction protein DptH
MSSDSILVGEDLRRRIPLVWTPGPETGNANPHLMIVGESGYGKTYAIQCLLTELARIGKSSVVLDYAQGFMDTALHPTFVRTARPKEIAASTRGININPLRISRNDANGPVNAAVRVSDTFARIYRIGIQQHSLLRDTILQTYERAGITRDRPRSWYLPAPTLSEIYKTITEYAENKEHPSCRTAQAVRSHLSSFFIFDTFRRLGEEVSWDVMFREGARCYIVQLHGLEDKTEKVVTEFLLWDLYNSLRSAGPRELGLFCVLDEAHKLSFSDNSPVDKLLREARKFGLGLMLASQQPDDFSTVAHANTATKLIFHTSDRRAILAKSLSQTCPELGKIDDISSLIARLPRGQALYFHMGRAHVVSMTSFEDRPAVRQRLTQWLRT